MKFKVFWLKRQKAQTHLFGLLVSILKKDEANIPCMDYQTQCKSSQDLIISLIIISGNTHFCLCVLMELKFLKALKVVYSF